VTSSPPKKPGPEQPFAPQNDESQQIVGGHVLPTANLARLKDGWKQTRSAEPAADDFMPKPAPDAAPLPPASLPPIPGMQQRPGAPKTQGMQAPNPAAPEKATPPAPQLAPRPNSPAPKAGSEPRSEQAPKPQPATKSGTASKAPGKPEKKRKGKSIAGAAAAFALDKKPGPIVPKGTIAGHALVLVIAIMSFLAALTVAAVSIISDATRDWQSEIGRGATIQIRQIDGINIESELAKAVEIARTTKGIAQATALTTAQSNALLEPWLGLDLAFDTLPVPRLIELTIGDPQEVDFIGLSTRLQTEVKGAILDNHRFWVDRLRSMAETAIFVGFSILCLVLIATVLTVIFATRSAMAGNRETIEVLHFVGAGNRFIASEFQRKFFTLGLKGSLAGGLAAILVFLLLQLFVQKETGSAAADQMQALLGVVELGTSAYIGTLGLTILIAILTAITTRLTVMKTLSKLH
jgi:cell division transport system permease protein